MSEESKSWYHATRPVFNSGFEDDEFWAYGQDGFQEVLDSFLGSDVLIYDKKISSAPQQVRAIFQQKTSDVYNSTTVRQILCNIGILHCGQYIKHEGAWWIVSALPDNNRIYEKAVLWKCKHTIHFLSPLTGEIVEYPVYSVNSTQYGTGESEKTQITVGEDQHLLYLPFNDETIVLDNGFRFLMDKNHINPSAYRVTRVDPVSYAVGEELPNDGLIQWAVLQTGFDEARDNKDLMIADYYSAKSKEESMNASTDGVLTLNDVDGDFSLALGETKQIKVKCTLADGTDVNSFEYRMEYDLADGAASVVSEENNTIILQAADDRRFVGAKITVRAISETLGNDAKIKIQIVNW